MYLSDVKRVISNMIITKQYINLCLIGHQGIGKTQILKQVAKEHGWNYCALYAAQIMVEDLSGLPKIITNTCNELETIFVKPNLLPNKENTIFVLEEINRAALDVQQAILQILTERKVGNFVLPNNIIICACINPGGNNYLVQNLDSVFHNRMCNINIVPQRNEFIQYALQNNFHQDIIKFISNIDSAQEDMYFAAIPEGDNIILPSPRTWELASNILKLQLEKDIELSMLAGVIGQDVAKKFLADRAANFEAYLDGLSVLTEYSINENLLTEYAKQNTGAIIFTINSLGMYLKSYKNFNNYCHSLLTDVEIQNVGKFLEMLCNVQPMLAILLFNLVDNQKDEIFYYIVLTYKKLSGVDLINKLVVLKKQITVDV